MSRRKCNVLGCKSTEDDSQLHRFPASSPKAEIWREFCCNPAIADIPADRLTARVAMCAKHFPVSQFRMIDCRRLNYNAVPSLLHPYSSSSSLPIDVPSSSLTLSSDLHLESSSSILPCTPTYSSLPSSPLLSPCENLLSSEVVSSTPSTSGPHRLFEHLTPIPTSPINAAKGSSTMLYGCTPLPLLEDDRHSLAIDSSASLSAISFRTTNVSGSSEVITGAQSQSVVRKGARRSILKELGMTRVNQLTPKKRVMYYEIQNQKRQINRWRNIVTDKYKSDFTAIPPDSSLLKAIGKNLSQSAVTFLCSLLREGQKKPKGRRWTHEEKVIALSIYKKSPRAYTFLRAIIPIPCRRTLTKLLASLPFCTGINPHIFHFLSSSSEKMSARDRHCVLMFDEMAISQGLEYDGKNDCIVGYEDHGERGRWNTMAKHALVFMIRGLWSKWKQPVAYYLSGNLLALALKDLIEEVLHHLNGTGLKVVATVCDMASVNVKALQFLGASYDAPWFEFEEQKVVTIFDPPHLLKSFRNMFMKCDVTVPVCVGGNTDMLNATWGHIREVYEDDGKNPCGRLFKLTERHLDPKTFDKMRVHLAAQVFSRQVQRGVGALVARGVLGPSGMATAQLLLLLNDFFDAMNGDQEGSKKSGGNHQRVPMTRKSHHLGTFRDLEAKIPVLNFRRAGKTVKFPSHNGCLATIKACRDLWERVGVRYNHMNTRSLNQDPLENLFSLVRQNCGCNHHPDGWQFVSALKTAVVNGLVTVKSRGNCEIDDCNSLSRLNEFFGGNQGESDTLLQESSVLGLCNMVEQRIPTEVNLPAEGIELFAIVAHYVAVTALKGNTCDICSSCLLSVSPQPCPREELVIAVGEGVTMLSSFLTERGHEKDISLILKGKLMQMVSFPFITCKEHLVSLQSKVAGAIISATINRHCKTVSRKMKKIPGFRKRW